MFHTSVLGSSSDWPNEFSDLLILLETHIITCTSTTFYLLWPVNWILDVLGTSGSGYNMLVPDACELAAMHVVAQ